MKSHDWTSARGHTECSRCGMRSTWAGARRLCVGSAGHSGPVARTYRTAPSIIDGTYAARPRATLEKIEHLAREIDKVQGRIKRTALGQPLDCAEHRAELSALVDIRRQRAVVRARPGTSPWRSHRAVAPARPKGVQ
jgi:hypothetical protein